MTLEAEAGVSQAQEFQVTLSNTASLQLKRGKHIYYLHINLFYFI